MISVITGTGRLKENKHIWTTRHFKSLSAWGYNLKECLCCFFSSCPQKTILYNILQWRVNPPPPKGVFLLNSNISAVYFSVFLKSVESEKLILINKKFSLVVLGILIQELRSKILIWLVNLDTVMGGAASQGLETNPSSPGWIGAATTLAWWSLRGTRPLCFKCFKNVYLGNKPENSKTWQHIKGNKVNVYTCLKHLLP